ncbi:MAG TPA: BrnA antitoxin family protein [Rhizomicrobium sp.]
MSDAQIRAAIASDPDAAPELDAAWFAKAKLVMPENKQLTSLRLDPDVLIWFRSFGKGYQTRINAVLRAYMKAHIR